MPPSNDEQDDQLLALLATLGAESEQPKNPTASAPDIQEPSDEELAALENELGLHDDLFDEDDSDSNANDEANDEADDDLPGGGLDGLAALLRAAAPPVAEEPGGFLLSPTQEAEKLLLHLIACSHLELEEGIEANSLAGGVANLLEFDRPAEMKARAISSWLCTQPGVYDLYCDDTTLEVILTEW